MIIHERISAAAQAGQLLPDTAQNLTAFLAARLPAWAEQSIGELVAKEAWGELNDRFYRFLEFGTGGMRGRTIAVMPTAAETGRVDEHGSPEHAGKGTTWQDPFALGYELSPSIMRLPSNPGFAPFPNTDSFGLKSAPVPVTVETAGCAPTGSGPCR